MAVSIKEVTIKNFRSIESLDLTFKDNCRILVGINEAGKSNILKALRLLSSDYEVVNADLRQFGVNDDYEENAYIKFDFKLSTDIASNILNNFRALFLTTSKNLVLGKQKTKNYCISDVMETINKGCYRIDIKTKKKYAQYYILPQNIVLNSNIKKVTNDCSNDFEITLKDKQTYKLKGYNYIDIDSLQTSEIPDIYLEDITIEDLQKSYSDYVLRNVKENLPKVIFWKYEDRYLLPSEIEKDSFISNPECCIPLKNMFELAGFPNISKAFQDAEKTNRGVKNMLTKVAQNATKHFKEAWKEYKDVEFELLENGEYLEPSIKELNSFEMEQRSDGFKRFVTFLLMVSINVKTEKLSGALIIVDEPEISLHPSGVRFLRDELLKIAKNNYVIYSTHSPFMIDKNDISRHYRVIKENEKTKVIETTQSDYTEEEVLLNALGTSIFEGLRQKNLIFEGWRDKKLFNIAISKIPAKFKNLKDSLKNIGTAHSKGVKDIKNIVPLIELANKECLIISDSDKPAKENQKQFIEKGYYGIWKRYDEIYDETAIITSEDFIKNSAFEKILKSIAKKYEISDFDITCLNSCSNGKIATITKWLNDNNVSDINSVLNEVKEAIFNELKTTQIEEGYYNFLENLVSIIN